MYKTATLGVLITLTVFYRVSFIIDDEYLRHSLQLIYKQLTKNFHPFFNLDHNDLSSGCLQLDLNSCFHPDTILEDKYLFNFELEYEDKKNLINRYGFTYDRLQGQIQHKQYGGISKFQGVQMSVWSYENWFQSQTCLFEKKMRVPSILEASEKSVMNQKQNSRISVLQASLASEECLKSVQVARIGYSLEKEAECKKAMEILKNLQYKSPEVQIKYIIKSDNHEGSGIFPLDDANAQEILQQYDNGRLCGQTNNSPLQIQEFVHNPLLIDVQDFQGNTQKHMFVFRVYFIVASTQPLIIYIYDKSSVYIALQPFQKEQFSKYSHFCHNNVIKQYLAEMGIQGQAAQDIIEKRDLMITFEELVRKLIQSGSLPQDTYSKTFFFNKIQEKISMFYTEIAEYVQDSRFAQNSAMDFIMDSYLNIYILELNNSYNLVERYDVRRIFLRELQYQNIELMLGVMRDRYKRIKRFLDDQLLPYLKKNGMNKRLTNDLGQALQKALADEPLNNLERVGDYLLLNISEGIKKCK